MTKPLFITEDEFLIRIKDWDPHRTIYFLDGIFHAVKDYQLTEIPESEAKQNLKDGFELWKMEEGKRDFNKMLYWYKVDSETAIITYCPVKEFLTRLFNTEFYQRVTKMTNNENNFSHN